MNAPTNRTPFALPLAFTGSEVNTSCWLVDRHGKRVCTMTPSVADSDRGQFIVTACNAHDGLVSDLAAARALNARLCEVLEPMARGACLDQRIGNRCICYTCTARSALAAAREVTP